MTPGSAQQAAMRILLEDVEPLVQRTEEVTANLNGVQAGLHADLETLGSLVRRSCEMQPALLELGRVLTGAAGRIERGSQQARAEARSSARPVGDRAWMFAASFVGTLLASLLLLLAGWSAGTEALEHARMGRALQRAWPALDADTRAKVQQAINGR